MRRLVLALGLLALASRGAPAQGSGAGTTARAQVFQRAQRLVNDGSGAEGRALVDSLLNATVPRTPAEAEVLFWRATLAQSWDHAQRDYLRVTLEHARSPFAAASMLRLAQGEMMRGDRDAALRYVERLLEQSPTAPERNDALALRARLMGAATPTAAPALPVPAEAAPQTPPVAAMLWSVQVAAFPTAAEARRVSAALGTRGYDARVDGTTAPFRVRIGRYATRAAAVAAMDAYKQKERADAFLVQVPRQ